MAWTKKSLKKCIKNTIGDRLLIIASNREPYIHIRKEGKIEYIRPVGGAVTALDPIMRVCAGTWVAYGSGGADREVVNSDSEIRVPPESPKYTLKRIWLTKDESRSETMDILSGLKRLDHRENPADVGYYSVFYLRQIEEISHISLIEQQILLHLMRPVLQVHSCSEDVFGGGNPGKSSAHRIVRAPDSTVRIDLINAEIVTAQFNKASDLPDD